MDGKHQRSEKSGLRTVTTLENIEYAKQCIAVLRFTRPSARKHVAALGKSNWSVSRILHKELQEIKQYWTDSYFVSISKV